MERIRFPRLSLSFPLLLLGLLALPLVMEDRGEAVFDHSQGAGASKEGEDASNRDAQESDSPIRQGGEEDHSTPLQLASIEPVQVSCSLRGERTETGFSCNFEEPACLASSFETSRPRPIASRRSLPPLRG